MPGMYMEGNKRVKYFPLKSISGFGKKKTKKKQRKLQKNKEKILALNPARISNKGFFIKFQIKDSLLNFK
jgi:hypothetical protein